MHGNPTSQGAILKTRKFDFFNAETFAPEFSFQYHEGEIIRHGWCYVWRDPDGKAMRWSTEAQRDAARACFTHRKTVAAAMRDLRAKRLHVGQPGQVDAAADGR